VNRQWVINASPLIALAKISHLFLLQNLCSNLLIPDGVVQEIEQGEAADPSRQWLRTVGKQWVQDVGAIDPVVAAWDLGFGETQVLSWVYKNPVYEAILDDRAARKCAAALGLRVRGTLGILLLAKKEGQVPSVRPLFDRLREAGFRVDTEVLRAALQLIGE
jgi:predicted nucleic acid-binding protein